MPITLPEILETAVGCHGAGAYAGTRVSYITYDAADLDFLQDWQTRSELRPEQTDVICVLGRCNIGQTSSTADLDVSFQHLAPGGGRMVCALIRKSTLA